MAHHVDRNAPVGPWVGLFGTWYQVLEGLATGLSNKAIARDYDISPRTVEVYRANVMTKMQATNLSELVRLAMRAGVLKD